MAKQLNFTYNGKEYCLEYTRASVTYMVENMGFRTDDVDAKMIVRLPQLFRGAFIAHHDDVKTKTIEAIYKTMGDKEGLFKALITMYNEPYKALLENPNGDEGNVTSWKVNWETEETDD